MKRQRQTRQYKFYCAVAGGKFLTRRPKEGAWPAFSSNVAAALKFVSEDEALEWLAVNGRPQVWIERHSQVIRFI